MVNYPSLAYTLCGGKSARSPDMPFQIHETLPFTHEQAVRLLMEAPWTRTERSFIVAGGLSALHKGFGKEMREKWWLWEPSTPLARYYQKRHGIGHADDMSGLIILDMIARMKGETFDLAAEVGRFRDYWLSRNIDPLSQKETRDEQHLPGREGDPLRGK